MGKGPGKKFGIGDAISTFGKVYNGVKTGIKAGDALWNGKGGGTGADSGEVSQAIEDAFNSALEMCGNPGQTAIIEGMGVDSFSDAMSTAMGEGGGSAEALLDICPYPEAVGEILEEVAQPMDDVASVYSERGYS